MTMTFRELTFGELPGHIRHKIAKGEMGGMKKLAEDLVPFVRYCEETKQRDIKMMLEDLLQRLKKGTAKALQQNYIDKLVNSLDTSINVADLKCVEPTLLYFPVDVYKSNIPGVRPLALYLEDYQLLKKLLIAILNTVNSSYKLYKRYDNIFRVNDIIEDNQTIIICGNAFAERLKVQGYPDSRIVCLDFNIRHEQTFLKSIVLPCSIEEFKDILSLQCGL